MAHHPVRKNMLLFIAFFVVLGINTLLIMSYVQLNRVKQTQSTILAELDKIEAESGGSGGYGGPLAAGVMDSEVKLVDGRSANLKRYLRRLNSPLFEHTDLLVEEADDKGYDYRLLVAIALQESTGCKFIPHDSHNCWGWGIYGDKVTRFDSYDDAIRAVSIGIKTHYIDKGLITTEDIMQKYTPSSNSWATAVRYFFRRIESS
ncbi:hypothetical protein A3F34_02080 [Candidatus Roizmanbacteria bacterium RIFCSPHIGHO2_12_FULL_44_10]|uniref:Mannosyl-glycoprotein endo-beta-N-acetylglucosamidase-like domain-containing protein n=1 Tax=Candidatus Roizmanbacteria bacterium RIFCSPHIGHO2_12_FULL_44_10 TaxID=1802054 RepID=A0A1F7I6D9_9BACT|nr:MAG: hypothetical protein A3F34_02080 [Candidatus Roizmanbacteria bacterium RIFCSPHIGHO2_12_FULL_44_10]